MQMVWDSAPCRENPLLVLLALADWSNEAGICWPSINRLAHKTRVDRRSAQRIIRKLIKDGLISIEEGGGRAKQHKYKIETAALCRPLENSGAGDIETAALETERATFPAQRVTPVSPDPLEEPLLKQPSIDPPYGGADFLSALSAFERQRTAMKKPLTNEALRFLYRKLSGWDEPTATQALEDAVINRWQGVFEPREERQNGSGQSRPNQTASERRNAEVIRIQQRAAELRSLGDERIESILRREPGSSGR